MPSLNFEGLPEYVTTSEEEDEDEEPDQYQDGYNYIDKFYKNLEDSTNQDLNEAKVLKRASEVNSFGFANSSEL